MSEIRCYNIIHEVSYRVIKNISAPFDCGSSSRERPEAATPSHTVDRDREYQVPNVNIHIIDE